MKNLKLQIEMLDVTTIPMTPDLPEDMAGVYGSPETGWGCPVNP